MSAFRRSREDIVRLGAGDDMRSYANALTGHGPQHETVIEVDRDDDLTSIRSKLESTRLPRVVLVLPSNIKSLRDGLEFRVLRRLQRELGLDLIIVSDDLTRRGFAQENGFRHVYSSMRGYYSSRIPTPDRSENISFTDPEEFTPALGISRWGLLMGAMLATILVTMAYLAIPVARVTVYPETQAMNRDVEVLVEIGGPRFDTTAQRISGQLVQTRVQVNASINVKDVAPPPAQPGSSSSGFQAGTQVTLAVRDALRQQMLKQASGQAGDQLRSQLKGDESMPEQSINTQIVSERYDHNIGDTSDTLGGTMEIVTSGLAYNNDDFNQVVLALWGQDVPRDFKQVGDPKMDPPAVVNAEGQHMTMRVHAAGLLRRDVDTGAVAAAVRGRKASDAQKILNSMGGFARPADIALWPGWANQAFRVQVKALAEAPST
ncbi:MAG: hypothetical protein M1582_00910 [Actinobacteria bacterium]|nr:hypothetical protein [Actinomycetota bacterium]